MYYTYSHMLILCICAFVIYFFVFYSFIWWKMSLTTNVYENKITGCIETRVVYDKEATILRSIDNTHLNLNPYAPTHRENNIMKKRLDEFTMVRKKTNFKIPGIHENTKIEYGNLYRDLKSNFASNKREGFKEIKHVRYYTTSIEERSTEGHNDSRNDFYKHSNKLRSAENTDSHKEEQIYKALTKQAELLGQLAKVIEHDEYLRQPKNDFENLLESLEKKKGYSVLEKDRTTVTTSVKETTTVKMPTLMAMVDETAVRLALKNDPYIKRILKMAAMKKEAYEKAAKKYYNFK